MLSHAIEWRVGGGGAAGVGCGALVVEGMEWLRILRFQVGWF